MPHAERLDTIEDRFDTTSGYMINRRDRNRIGVLPMDPPTTRPACRTLSVPEAGRQYFDLSRNAAYEAARRGDIPTIKIGRLLRVPVVALERKLEEAGR
jgi:hypothetical protein